MDEKTKDGGPAFPSEGGPDSGVHPAPGMSLRDYFAAKAMVPAYREELERSRLARHRLDGASDRAEREAAMFECSKVAEDAYAIADAMLAERAK